MKQKKKWILVAIPFFSLLAIESSYAQSFYKWVDDKGATHYTQAPPPQKPAKKVAISTHIPQDSANAIKNLNAQSTENLKATASNEEIAAQKRLKAAADTERRNKNSAVCQQLKNSQAQLQSGQRLRTVDAYGQKVFLTEAQKAQQVIDQSLQIKSDCPQ